MNSWFRFSFAVLHVLFILIFLFSSSFSAAVAFNRGSTLHLTVFPDWEVVIYSDIRHATLPLDSQAEREMLPSDMTQYLTFALIHKLRIIIR